MGHPPVYLDYQSTTPVDPRVLEAMLPFFKERFGNPHSAHHSFGRLATEAIGAARRAVAALIEAQSEEIIFTSGATEANNLALRGVIPFLKEQGKTHIISTRLEHACVLEVLEFLKHEGFSISFVEVGASGLVSPQDLARHIRPDTGLVTVMMVNNEIGVVQPLEEIGALCARQDILFHTDAAQGVGKVPIDVRRMNLAMMSISAHKLYAPKGIGALYVRRLPKVPLSPLILGGGQERGLRSGTLPAPLCVAFGVACDIAAKEMASEAIRLTQLRDHFLERLRARCADVQVQGSLKHRIPGNLNIRFSNVDAEVLVMKLQDRVAISTGSACTSEKMEVSHVLLALGLSPEEAECAVRIGFGRFTSLEEVDYAVDAIVEIVQTRRRFYRGKGASRPLVS